MNQTKFVFNRGCQIQSSAGWIHIVPKGELPNADAGIVQMLDDASLDSILSAIEKDKNRLGDKWPGIYAGREHFIYDEDKDSAALGWFKDFQKRPDGIWAKDDGLTPAGSEAIKNREYKFTSFVSDPADLRKVEGDKYRVMKIETIGFTNLANGKELLTPCANRGNFGSHKTETAWNAARAENMAHVEANKAATGEAEAQRKADSEGEANELALPALEKFCRAVKSVMDASGKTGHKMMDDRTAWTYAQVKFPDLYAAAFGADDLGADADAAKAITKLANRIGALSGKNFEFGWNFVKEELPHIFNRQTPPAGRITNRVNYGYAARITQKAAKIFNRLASAESFATGLPVIQAANAIRTRHPGICGLAEGSISPSKALNIEPSVWALILKNESRL